jgi:hypothetical protein
VIGLQVQDRSTSVVTLGVTPGSAPLVVLETRSGVRPASRRATLGLYHFAILLPDRVALGRFLAHLGRLGEYAGMSDHLVSEALYLSDPDGLGIEVYADRTRSLWEYPGGQLAMATKPLDVQDLLASGGTTPWTGLPEGTVIGHERACCSGSSRCLRPAMPRPLRAASRRPATPPTRSREGGRQPIPGARPCTSSRSERRQAAGRRAFAAGSGRPLSGMKKTKCKRLTTKEGDQ